MAHTWLSKLEFLQGWLGLLQEQYYYNPPFMF